MESSNIHSMIRAVLESLENLGFAQNSLKVYEHSAFAPILRKYESNGIDRYCPETMNELMEKYENQLGKGVISHPLFNIRKRGLLLLKEFHKKGSISLRRYGKPSSIVTPKAFLPISEEFLDTLDMTASSRSKIMVVVKRFLSHVDALGVEEPQGILPEHLREFIRTSHETAPKNMESVIYALRKFFLFLERKGHDIRRIWLLLSVPVRARAIQPAFSAEELVQILRQVDTSTPPGKRDFAILSLAVTTGLRSGDIARMELSDIAWKEREIQLVQHKTGKALALPLQKSVADAVADYILNERPASESRRIFLGVKAPHTGFRCGSTMAGILEKYAAMAGIHHQPGDGKSFHGIRRFIGTSMAQGNVPTPTVAQVLGHQGISATRQYIAIDIEGLRRCVLPMTSLGGDTR